MLAPAPAQAAIGQPIDQALVDLREARARGLKSSQALPDSYASMVSGVLIGMSDALAGAGATPAKPGSRKK